MTTTKLGDFLWEGHSDDGDVRQTAWMTTLRAFAPEYDGDPAGGMDDQQARSAFDEATAQVASTYTSDGVYGVLALEELVGRAVRRVEEERAAAVRRHYEIRRSYIVTGRSEEQERQDESDAVRGTSGRYLTYFFNRQLALNPMVPLGPGEGTPLQRVFGRKMNPRLTRTNPSEYDYILVPVLEMAEAEEEVAAADSVLGLARLRLWVVRTVAYQLGLGVVASFLQRAPGAAPASAQAAQAKGEDTAVENDTVGSDRRRPTVPPTWQATYFEREVSKPLVHAAAIVHFWDRFADQIDSEEDFRLIFDAAGFSLKPESALRRIREAFLRKGICGSQDGRYGYAYKGDWSQFVECARAFLEANGVSVGPEEPSSSSDA